VVVCIRSILGAVLRLSLPLLPLLRRLLADLGFGVTELWA